jgi:hypothetical protein
MLLVAAVLLAASPTDLALLSKPVDGSTLEVRWQPLDQAVPSEPFARLEAAVDETFHGAVLPGGAVAVVHVKARAADLSFAAVLTVVSPGAPERRLATQVVLASRPIVMGQRLFVQRGTAGPPTADGTLRVDALELTEVDVSTGRLRTVFSTRGFWTHVGGTFGRELIVYVSEPRGARLIALHVDTLAVRTLVPSLAPLAHDFAVDLASKAVFFSIADPGVERWFVERVDLLSGARSRIAEGDVVALLPTVLPGGVAFSPGPGRGLSFIGKDTVALAPRGPGLERVSFVVEGLAVGLHEDPGALPRPFVVRLRDGAERLVAWPEGVIVEPAGVRR